VESAGEHGTLTLTEIPHVERVSATLFQLVEEERQRDDAPPPGPDDHRDGRPMRN
jgi:hypothetical protein